MNELLGIFCFLGVSAVAYFTVQVLEKKHRIDKAKLTMLEYDYEKKQEAERIQKEPLPNLIARANERLRKRRGSGS